MTLLAAFSSSRLFFSASLSLKGEDEGENGRVGVEVEVEVVEAKPAKASGAHRSK